MNRVTLENCPVGLFRSEAGELCLKTEYANGGKIEAYIVRTGEFFCGGSRSAHDQRNVLVLPVSETSLSIGTRSVTAQQIADARRMLETIRPFTSRPMGGEGSRARRDQESRKAAFDELQNFLNLLTTNPEQKGQ